MTKQFKGYMEDVRITRGDAAQKRTTGWRLRWALLWGAIKNLFTGRGVWLSGLFQMSVGTPSITAECWINHEGEGTGWEYWVVTFDGKKAVGHSNGVEVKG